nr:uncharacterized protein LOC109178464 [Ipomoea trifida]
MLRTLDSGRRQRVGVDLLHIGFLIAIVDDVQPFPFSCVHGSCPEISHQLLVDNLDIVVANDGSFNREIHCTRLLSLFSSVSSPEELSSFMQQRSVLAFPESDHTPSSSPAPNLSQTTSSPTVSESSSAEQPAASVLAPSISPATAPDLPAASGRPARIQKPNSRYYGDQFVNITTVHPMPLALKPRTVTQAMRDDRWRQAMCDEFDDLVRLGTYTFGPRGSPNTASSFTSRTQPFCNFTIMVWMSRFVSNHPVMR